MTSRISVYDSFVGLTFALLLLALFSFHVVPDCVNLLVLLAVFWCFC